MYEIKDRYGAPLLAVESGTPAPDLTGVNLRGAKLRNAALRGARLNYADLAGADLAGADLVRACLSSVCLAGAHLTGAVLCAAKANFADLRGASADNAEFVSCRFENADLSEAVFRGSKLVSCNFQGARLRGATFAGAHLAGCKFHGVDLTAVKLAGAAAAGCDFSGATGLLDAPGWMEANFDKDAEGYLVYKRCGSGRTQFPPPERWKFEPGAVLTERVNPSPFDDCGCGVNFGTRAWCERNYDTADLWLCRLAWRDLPGLVVPYATDGKARCGRLTLLENLTLKGEAPE